MGRHELLTAAKVTAQLAMASYWISVFVFDNEGTYMGCSSSFVHGRIVTLLEGLDAVCRLQDVVIFATE